MQNAPLQTDHAPQPVPVRPRVAAALALLGLLAGCAGPPKPQASGPAPRLYAIDLQGAAKLCKVTQVKPQAGKTVAATMTIGNDGGWCAIAVHQTEAGAPEPYAAGLLTARAAHGRVYIHTVGADTRIDYTPVAGYAGPDRFSVSLLPESAAIQVSVTVQR